MWVGRKSCGALARAVPRSNFSFTPLKYVTIVSTMRAPEEALWADRHWVIGCRDTFVFVRPLAYSASVSNASFVPRRLLRAPSASSIVAVVVVKLAANDVIAQILHLLPVRVKSLHSSRETSTAGQV